MSQPDPLDGKIREALAHVVSDAPTAPDFDDIEPSPVPRWRRRSRPIALAAAAVVVVVLAGVALTGTDHTTVDTGTADTSLDRQGSERDGGAPMSCEERASRFAAEETDVLVFLQPDSSLDQHDEVARAIEEAADVEVVRFVDQQATFDEFRELFADAPHIVESVTAEILPPRFEVRVAGASPMDVVTAALGTNAAVREIIDLDQVQAQMLARCAEAGEGPTTTVGAADGAETEAATADDGVEATIYVYELVRAGDGTLTPITVRVPGDDVLEESLAVLWGNPPPHLDGNTTTAIPYSSELLSVTVDPSGRALVDTSGLRGDDGIHGIELVRALAQIVWTATAHTGVGEVQVLDEGEPAPVPIDGLVSVDRPVTRADYAPTATGGR